MVDINLRAIIIDDERHCIETLRYELTTHCPEVTIVATHQDTLGGIQSINTLEPDIVFLDIELENATGFQLVEALGYRSFQLIFTTAYDKYTIEAIRIKAFDYLMKPVSGVALKKSIDRMMLESDQSVDNPQLAQTPNAKIILPIGNSSIFLSRSEIIRVQSDGNFSIVYCGNNKEHYVSKSLKEIERLLNSPRFLRIHKSHIVNVDYIVAYYKSDGGRIAMSDGIKLPITQVSISDIKELISNSNL